MYDGMFCSLCTLFDGQISTNGTTNFIIREKNARYVPT